MADVVTAASELQRFTALRYAVDVNAYGFSGVERDYPAVALEITALGRRVDG